MKKQTAVELLEKIASEGFISPEDFEQAKELEKQQMMNIYWDGGQDIPLTEERCEQYYNENYGKSKSPN